MSQGSLKDRPQDKCYNQRRKLIVNFSKDVAYDPEDNHDEHVKLAIVYAIRADDAQEEEQRKKNPIGNLQYFHPETNQRKIQNHKHCISNIHADDCPPKDVRVFIHKGWTSLHTMDHQGSQE